MFDLDGHAALRPGGDMPGYESAWCADREAGPAAIVLMNGPLAPGISAYAVRLLRAAREQGALPPPPLSDPARIANAADYADFYRMGERTLALTAEGERLVLHHGAERVMLEQRGDDHFYVPHPRLCALLAAVWTEWRSGG